jgi:hypothetical protein
MCQHAALLPTLRIEQAGDIAGPSTGSGMGYNGRAYAVACKLFLGGVLWQRLDMRAFPQAQAMLTTRCALRRCTRASLQRLASAFPSCRAD